MKVISAILHAPVGIPGVMAPNQFVNPTKVPGIKLEWIDGVGLHFKSKGRVGFFPQATVAWVELEPEDKASKKAA